MRKPASAFFALLLAATSALPAAAPAIAHSRNGDAAIVAGVALAIIGGIALSRHHHRDRYYSDYDDGGYYEAPSYSYRRSYYGNSHNYRSQNSYGAFSGVPHGHSHHHHH